MMTMADGTIKAFLIARSGARLRSVPPRRDHVGPGAGACTARYRPRAVYTALGLRSTNRQRVMEYVKWIPLRLDSLQPRVVRLIVNRWPRKTGHIQNRVG
jgi:hypothetical protein